jgi:hypothetical protein
VDEESNGGILKTLQSAGLPDSYNRVTRFIQQGCQINNFPYNFGSNRHRNMILVSIPMFFFRGLRIEWGHFENCPTSRVARFIQQGSQIDSFQHHFGSNWPRNMIMMSIPCFLGWGIEWRHFEMWQTKMVARSLQQTCQTDFFHVTLVYYAINRILMYMPIFLRMRNWIHFEICQTSDYPGCQTSKCIQFLILKNIGMYIRILFIA